MSEQMEGTFSRIDARVGAIRKVNKWGPTIAGERGDEQARNILKKLLGGYGSWELLKEAHAAEHGDGPITRHLENLNGPHGFTYYRMLKAVMRLKWKELGLTEGQRLRSIVYDRFEEWDVPLLPRHDLLSPTYNNWACHLCWLLSRDTFFAEDLDTSKDMTDREWSICEALAGANGFAYYKMLKARLEHA